MQRFGDDSRETEITEFQRLGTVLPLVNLPSAVHNSTQYIIAVDESHVTIKHVHSISKFLI